MPRATEEKQLRTLHDKKVWVVDVELHALEQVLYGLLRRPVTADEVFALTVDRDLRTRGPIVQSRIGQSGRNGKGNGAGDGPAA